MEKKMLTYLLSPKQKAKNGTCPLGSRKLVVVVVFYTFPQSDAYVGKFLLGFLVSNYSHSVLAPDRLNVKCPQITYSLTTPARQRQGDPYFCVSRATCRPLLLHNQPEKLFLKTCKQKLFYFILKPAVLV